MKPIRKIRQHTRLVQDSGLEQEQRSNTSSITLVIPLSEPLEHRKLKANSMKLALHISNFKDLHVLSSLGATAAAEGGTRGSLRKKNIERINTKLRKLASTIMSSVTQLRRQWLPGCTIHVGTSAPIALPRILETAAIFVARLRESVLNQTADNLVGALRTIGLEQEAMPCPTSAKIGEQEKATRSQDPTTKTTEATSTATLRPFSSMSQLLGKLLGMKVT